MFIEDYTSKGQHRGWIEVVCGSMFSGKTEELIRRLKRARFAKQQVEIFKPLIDNRYHKSDVVSHNANSIPSTPVKTPQEILDKVDGIEVIGIDEAQFFDESLIDVCNQLANRGIRVIVAGLDMDYLGKPFGPVPGIMAIAEFVTKVHAVCVNCGALANQSHRIVKADELVLVGEMESYEPLCRFCFNEKMQANA